MGEVVRKILTGAFMVAVLLTGCGGGGEEPADEGKGQNPAAQQSKKPKGPGGDAVEEGTPHEVTIEVKGSGKSNIMYTLDDSDFVEATLPWKKTARIAARGAERRVGRLVIVTPGTMARPDGKLVASRS